MVLCMGSESPDEELPKWCTAEVLVLGCGNPLMGDDGLGPAVAELLLSRIASSKAAPQKSQWAPSCVINAGTGSRGIIFNLVAGPVRPKLIIIIDALNAGKRPGELFWVNVEDLSIEKAEDFSLHMTPASNMLLDLQKAGVEIRILACQPKNLPEFMSEGLSPEVLAAVGPAAEMVMDEAMKRHGHQAGK
jgi:coenzyme F420 hydrogenase subunit delta